MGTERYDRAITVFAPDGHLLQVEYAQQATRKGSTVVGVRGTDVVVLGVEKKAVPALQIERTVRKIFLLDEHVAFTFSGLTADARILVNRAQVECQSHRLTVEVPSTLLYITRFLATLMQKYTQSNGRRPFGISCLLGGFDVDGTPRLYQIEPTGIYYEWKAAATGRAAETVRKFLEDNYKEDTAGTEGGAVTLAIRALLEVVHSDVNNFDIAVISRGQPITILDKEISRKYLQIIEQAKEDECEKQKAKRRREC